MSLNDPNTEAWNSTNDLSFQLCMRYTSSLSSSLVISHVGWDPWHVNSEIPVFGEQWWLMETLPDAIIKPHSCDFWGSRNTREKDTLRIGIYWRGLVLKRARWCPIQTSNFRVSTTSDLDLYLNVPTNVLCLLPRFPTLFLPWPR
jgi:hypothetical protein